MCEIESDVLAEFSLKNQEDTFNVTCICSRTFIRTKVSKQFVSSEQSASEEDNQLDEDLCRIYEDLTIQNVAAKSETEQEGASCYWSASHTDNLSTDEHESLREIHTAAKPLQQSDSGTDLNEHLIHDIESDWNKFWSLYGEKLIWESWIDKYSQYINPDYIPFAHKKVGEEYSLLAENSAEENSRIYNPKKFTFSEKDVQSFNSDLQRVCLKQIDKHQEPLKKESNARNQILLRTLSGSDEKISAEISEGWNPLSPLSIDEEIEAERLLTSRCCSRTSSSLKTIDSITNVTRMTVSSLDLSNSTTSSESFSSVSSVNSSVSSEDSDEDYQHQWNALWKKHYEDQYLEQYNKFIQSVSGIVTTATDKTRDMSISDQSTKTAIHDQEDSTLLETESTNFETDEQIPSISHSNTSSEEEEENTIYKEMIALGLPTAFGPNKIYKSLKYEDGEFNQSPKGNCDFLSNRSRTKAAFNLIGIEFKETSKELLSGEVNYKMKHIRQQNRHLQIRPEVKKPRHFIFDEEGNMFRKENEETTDHNIFSESSDNELSSCEEEVVAGEVSLSPTVEEKTEEVQPTKRKRRKRKQRPYPPEIKNNDKLRKYWQRRFSLFSKFDMGIKLDEESWYSVTPEQVAKHTAERCQCDVIVDAFCGAGGNSIQFAFYCKKVIAIDIDPKKIELAENNAKVYGVWDKIEFIIGDFLQLAGSLKADVVYLSPPWGGPSYLCEQIYDLEEMLLPVPFSQLIAHARMVSSNVAAFLPRNSNTFVLTKEAGKGGKVEIEQNFINKKLVAITAYYNELIKEK